MKKYKLLKNEFVEHEGKRLYRIEALRDFSNVKKGERGGYIEKEENLSHKDNSWVYDNARVFDNACVFDNAEVYGDARVSDNARVSGNARVSE